MATAAATRRAARLPKAVAWLPLAVLPLAAAWTTAARPRWAFMWALAASVYAGLKWLTLADSAGAAARAGLPRSAGYLLLWPGMNAVVFLGPAAGLPRPACGEWALASAKLAFGLLLIYGVAPLTIDDSPLLAGWLGMAGVVFVLHFGLFHLLSICWRRAGVDAPPLMHAPVLSASLSEFWGRRWNVAFRDLAHAYVFRPLVGRWGATAATLAVFLVSGVVHDLVISAPAGAGYGLPTMYFLLQAVGLITERSRPGRLVGLGRGPLGRVYCYLVTVGPAGLVFHRPFVERVVIPMLDAVGSL